MRFSLRFNNDLPARDYIALAQAAERADFDQFWVSNDLFLQSAPVILTAIAGATERIQIGSCIFNPYTINPAELAMFAATLDDYSGGRFNLGLAAGAADFLGWVGISHEKPLSALIEVIGALRKLFNGENAATDGQFLHWSQEAYLRFEPRRQVPIYIGAMSANMLRAIGEHADGGLPLLFPPEHYANVMPLIAEGATRAARDLSAVDVAACIWCSVHAERDAAERPLREKVAYYGHALSPLILSQLGLTHDDFKDIERAVMQENDMPKARELVTPQMLRIGIAGTTSDLIARVEALAEMGARHISFGPPLAPNPLEGIEQIGREVIPYFRKRYA